MYFNLSFFLSFQHDFQENLFIAKKNVWNLRCYQMGDLKCWNLEIQCFSIVFWQKKKICKNLGGPPIAKGAQNDWKKPMTPSKTWNLMFHHCVLTVKKISENRGVPDCKGCPEWLKKANDSIKDLKLNVSSLSFDRKKNQRKSGCPLLQRVPRNIEKSQWFSSKSWNLEIQWFIIVGFDRKNSAKIWVPPIAFLMIEKKPMIDIKEEEMENLKGNKKNILAGKMIWLA